MEALGELEEVKEKLEAAEKAAESRQAEVRPLAVQCLTCPVHLSQQVASSADSEACSPSDLGGHPSDINDSVQSRRQSCGKSTSSSTRKQRKLPPEQKLQRGRLES